MLRCKRKMQAKATAVLVGALILALGACAREDANRGLVFSPDSSALVVPLAAPPFNLTPSGDGSVNTLELISFDPTAIDAFGRSTLRTAKNSWPHWNYWYGAGEFSFGDVLGLEQGFETAQQDPRLPKLTGDQADFSYDYMFLFMEGNGFGIGNNWFGEYCCAPPGENFVLGIVRYGLQINGELDAQQILQGQPVDQPDSLFLLGGTPKGDPTVPANIFATYPNPGPDANPLIIGAAPSCPLAMPYEGTCAGQGYDDGTIVIDVVVQSATAGGSQIWESGTNPTGALSFMAPNNLQRYTFPQYNYLVIWHANPDGSPDYSRPLVRVQLGVDLSSFGGPINNAFAPFPTAALSDAQLALGNGALSRPDSLKVRFANLKQLKDPSVYKLWALMDDGSTQALDFVFAQIKPLAEGEDTLVAPTVASSFKGGEGLQEVNAKFPDNATHVFLTVESSDNPSSPSSVQPLWVKALQEPGNSKSLSLSADFGTFGLNKAADQRTWGLGGAGKGALFGNELRILFSDLPRPPVGYQYVGWLSSGDTAFARLPDATFTSPPPNYVVLDKADVDASISPVIKPETILEAMSKFCLRKQEAGCSGPFAHTPPYTGFTLTLEPKAGTQTTPAPTSVLTGGIPSVKPQQ